jgi:DNA-binding SARP family transcriptional activator
MTGRANMRLELRVLGGFDVRCDGEPIRQWTRAGPRQLLKRLVVNERQSIRAEALAEAFWPDDRSDRGMQRLHQLVYLLRKTLQSASSSAQHPETGVPCLRTDDGVVRLVSGETLWIDVVEFERQLDAAAPTNEEQGPLEQALTLYRGRLLGDDADDDWLAPRRAQLEGRFVAASYRLATLQIQQGRLQAAIQTLNKLLAEVPSQELAHRELITLYGRLGRAADVQRQFNECVAILQRELDVQPAAETCTAH